MAPELAGLAIADPPERWEALGFAVADGVCALGGVAVTLGVEGQGITSWSLAPSTEEIDGLLARAPTPINRSDPHPNGAIGIDHVVIVTPDFERTQAALERAGMPLRRIRDAGGLRQGFRRIGPAILELVEAVTAAPGPASFWGLVAIVEDLDALAGEHVSEPRPAVQPRRRIATVRRSAGLSTRLALMSPEP